MGLTARENKGWWSSIVDPFKDIFTLDYSSDSLQTNNTNVAWKNEGAPELTTKEKLALISVPVLIAADTAGDIAVAGYDTYQLFKSPTKENWQSLGIDVGALALPFVSAPVIKAGAKFVDEFAEGARVVNKRIIKTASEISDDTFVRIDPTIYDKSINNLGIQTKFSVDGKVWITKYGDIKNVTKAQDFETILYRKNLWVDQAGKFTEGATIRVIKNADDAVAAGITNMSDRVRQWRLLRDIPAEDLQILRRIE